EINKMESPDKIIFKKFCNHCRKVIDHKKTEKLK
ncbi:50S ribosomal protein L33, partial [Patescibacteria group bacterium]|nr:50S ribosomal protein L33 [Patescibacteria group bacterium]